MHEVKAARVDVSAIEVVAGRLQTRVLDRAIQLFGAMGLTPDTPLADPVLPMGAESIPGAGSSHSRSQAVSKGSGDR